MFKIETHVHTSNTSKCGHIDASVLVQKYIEGGYDAVVVTDHFNRATVDYLNIDLKSSDAWKPFFYGYDAFYKAAEGTSLKVYRGAEVRFDGSENDYLLYGFDPELISNPDSVMSGTLEDFYKKCQKSGAVLIQAHPFRDGCFPSDPQFLDGAEVFNLHPRQNNNNSKALQFAKDNNLLMTAGSDCHRMGDYCRAGIVTDVLPKDTFEFAELLKSENYYLFCKTDRTYKHKYEGPEN